MKAISKLKDGKTTGICSIADELYSIYDPLVRRLYAVLVVFVLRGMVIPLWKGKEINGIAAIIEALNSYAHKARSSLCSL